MKTTSAEDFKKKYGNDAYTSISRVSQTTAETTDIQPSFLQRVGTNIVEGIKHPIDRLAELSPVNENFISMQDGKPVVNKEQAQNLVNSTINFIGGENVIKDTAQKAKTFADSIFTNFKSTEKVLPETKITEVPKTIEQIRADKIKQGFEEQNMRLKSADKSFNQNTKTYKAADGTLTKVTPIDTFSKYNIAPTIERGSIDMGDYKTGQGALGKIKKLVSTIDTSIDTKLDPNKMTPIEDFIQEAYSAIKKDPTLKQSGKVESTLKKLDSIFNDYIASYGNSISETEINAIRKTMNLDYNPETIDISRIIGDAARKIVYDSTPNGEVKQLLRDQGELISAKKYAETINGTKVSGGKIGNYVMRTGGAILGSSIKNLPVVGPLIGMIGGEYLARIMQQSQFKNLPEEARQFIIEHFGSGSSVIKK